MPDVPATLRQPDASMLRRMGVLALATVAWVAAYAHLTCARAKDVSGVGG